MTNSTQTQLMESIPCPKFSRLPVQTLDPDDSGLPELKNELGMDSPLMSTEVLEDSDDKMTYSPAAEANGICDPPGVVDIELVSGCRSVQPVASSWNENEDGFAKLNTGAGLGNLGNTCFFNAVLQCFTHSVSLVQGLYSHAHPTPCDCSNDRFCLICTLRKHVEISLSSAKKVIYPWKFINNLSYFSSSFRRYQQEDAHEFLQCFLDRLESSFNVLETKDDMTQTDNLVKQVFGGRVISKLRCCNCNHVSDTYEPSVDLSLEIGDVNSLATALESFTKVEHIEDEEMKFTCDECKQKVSVEKQLLLDQIPRICAFHLKRFKNDGSHVEKIDKHVDFPLELDLQPCMCDSPMSLKYELYAVVVHSAFTSSCGHYYCYIRFAPDIWYKFDDSQVISVTEAQVLSEEPYILFYAKQGTPWFSNFMETYKPSFYPNILSPKSVLENVDPPSVKSDVALIKPIVNVVKEKSPFILKEYGSNHKNEFAKNIYVTPVNDSKRKIYIHDLLSPKSVPRNVDPPSIQFDDVFKEKSPVILKEYGSNRGVEADKNTCVTPKLFGYLGVVFAAKPNQVKLVEKVTFKRQRNNEVDDSAKREAMKMCKKMPGSRGALLMAAMSSKSENSLAKKSKKMMSSPRKNGCKSVGRFSFGCLS
ncbi:ubiquitin carboxyl-terminal hydrolase 20-like [Bidens hawaiensis]|uniref:ubiquitin carboxyl-terminal hydrolase 20-like n=1 Tax=Bidens hawaiensis TaxID=980011 RepID=UPI00404B6FFA